MRYVAAPLSVLAILAGATSFGIFAASRPAHAWQEPAPLPPPPAAGTAPAPAVPAPAAPSPEADAQSRATQAAIHLSELAAVALPPATPEQMAHRWFAGAVARVSQPAPARTPRPASSAASNPAPRVAAGAATAAHSSASGQIGGSPFRVDTASLSGTVLTLRQGNGWQAEKEVAIFFYGQHIPSLGKELVESPRNSLRDQFAPHINLSWTPLGSGATAQLPRRTRSISQGYVLRIRYDSFQNGLLHGTIDLRLPGGDYVAGTFTAEAR